MKSAKIGWIPLVLFSVFFLAHPTWAQSGSCETLVEGWNEGFMVNGIERSFYLDLPEGVEQGGPWAVVFNWHGLGDSARNFHRLIEDLVDSEVMPFIGVTPEDTNMLLDWDIIDAMDPQNREALLFDALLEEIDLCWGVDWDHVHGMGFSLGASIANMLGVLRGDVLASIASYSGGYASNPRNFIPYILTRWPALTTTNKFVELRVHGLVLNWMILPFGQYGTNDLYYMNENGHDYIDCTHRFTHSWSPTFMDPVHFVQFFADHPWGTFDSPYESGIPEDFPDSCFLSPKE